MITALPFPKKETGFTTSSTDEMPGAGSSVSKFGVLNGIYLGEPNDLSNGKPFPFSLQVMSSDAEAVETTEQNRLAFRNQERRLNSKCSKKLTIRIEIAILAKDVYHRVCWPSPSRVPVDTRLVALNSALTSTRKRSHPGSHSSDLQTTTSN